MTIAAIITAAAKSSHSLSFDEEWTKAEQFAFACGEMESSMTAHGIELPKADDGAIRGDVLDSLWDAMAACWY